MAIDTRNKRSSAINPQSPWRGQWPAPDSTIDQADRQHTLWSYAGILAGAPVAVVPDLWFTAPHEQDWFTAPVDPDLFSSEGA